MFYYNSLSNAITGSATGKAGDIANKESDYASSTLNGVKIMKALRKRVPAVDQMSEERKLEELYTTFAAEARTLGWTWAPGNGSSYGLIDNQTTSSQCKSFAGGMFYLAVAPPPFGLGMPWDKSWANGVTEYRHKPKNGFVSEHPSDGVLNLAPNVYMAEHTKAAEDIHGKHLYYWDNHWVVRYKEKIYDPTYGKEYAQLEDMELLSVEACEVLAWDKSFDSLEQDDAYGVGVLKLKSKSDREYYIRLTPTSLRASEKYYQGPFTPKQRDWLQEQFKGRWFQSLRAAIKASEVFAAGA